MKTSILLVTLIAVTILSCTPTIQPNIEKTLPLLEYKIEEAIGHWSSEKAKHPNPDKSQDGTWLDVGVRYKYLLMKKYVNIDMLKTVTGEPVFISGPHQNGINYNSEKEIGHYNPAFLAKIKSGFKTAMKREAFNVMAQKYYDSELKSMARTYYRAYKAVKDRGGKDAFEDIQYFVRYANQEEKAGYNWYEADTAPSFWVRRFTDNTADDFIEILKMVLDKYDTEFEQ